MSAPKSAPAAPLPRGGHGKRFYPAGSEAQTLDYIRSLRWFGYCLLPDIHRLAQGKAQIAFLWSVYFHTEAAPHSLRSRKWTPPEYTQPMLAEDFATEAGFARTSLFTAIEDAVSRGLVARKGEEVPDRHCYKLLRAGWPAMPSVEGGLRK